uniref:Xylanase inhibitor N-terminal domain-containing protein n=1 Tax=Kalanchoe fedtschenkoi TaxID=63787 RepID=A0A7N0V8B4_KALFE
MSNWITPNSPTTDLVFHAGEYLMKIRVDTLPVNILTEADTESDLTRTQCQPCTRCVPQRQPLFSPRASLSYGRISCSSSRPCPPWNDIECRYGLCHHDIRYADRSYTRGFFSTETMRMDSTTHSSVEIPSYIFCCRIDSGGYFGELSRRKFSYCLNPIGLQGRVSHIHFGDRAAVHGSGTVTVPLALGQLASLYNVTLEVFTIRRARISFIGGSGAVEEGNIVIDSGETLINLPRHFYQKIMLAMTVQIRLDLYFRKDRSLQLPSMVANFRGGDVPLKWYNAFVMTKPMTCLAFGDFLVGFYKMAGTLLFKPFDCTNA